MDFIFAMSHWPESNKTLVFLCGLSKPERVQLYKILRPAAALADSPSLLPTILLDLRADRANFFIEECHGRIIRVESTTGIFGGTSERRAAQGCRPDWKGLDFDFITQELTTITSELAYSAFSTADHMSTIDFICNEMAVVPHQLSTLATPPVTAKLKSLRSFFHGVHEHASYLTERTKAQVQNVYNLNAQQNSAINIEIAQNSLRLADLTRKDNVTMQELAQASRDIAAAAAKDSAYMRVISEVTMVFLPAIFVATLFSTTFFYFQAGRHGKVVSWWFWLYCLVSVLLTAVVQLYWYLVARRKGRLVAQASLAPPVTAPEANATLQREDTVTTGTQDSNLAELKQLGATVTSNSRPTMTS